MSFGGFFKGLGKWAVNRVDPTGLALGALSMLGGDDPEAQRRQSFSGAGLADPKTALQQALSALYRTGQGLTERGPARLRSSVVSPPPAPVQIKGLPFQIGGGLGTDPALLDPSILSGTGRDMPDPRGGGAQTYDPFQSIAQGQFAEGAAQRTAARRRKPNGA